jgi:branched-chain amino acid transport system permease protein
LLTRLRQGKYQRIIALAVACIILLVWKPIVITEGLQRAGLYAAVALPMAFILGIIGIINLAHGDFMMLGAYLAYWFSVGTGMDPLVAIVPALLAFAIIGAITYLATIRPVLRAPELNQLLLTFGLAMVLEQLANLLWTSQPRKLSPGYVTSSVTIGSFTFGIYGFVFLAAALAVLATLLFFLRRTRTGRAARAVGQNPRGARFVGIDVDRTYLVTFTIAIAITGALGVLFSTRYSVFPLVGSPYTMKSFCLVAMAGIGDLTGIVWYSLLLGLSERFILSFRGYGGWADIVFFVLIVLTITIRSYRQRVT